MSHATVGIHVEFSWPEGKPGAFTASYDDGPKEDRRLVDVFNRCGIKGTWNLNAGRVPETASEAGAIAWPEIPGLYAGHEMAVHSFSHPSLDRLPEERILLEIAEDRKRLEAAVKYPVKGMSLPNGAYDRRVLQALGRVGIVHCRTTRSTSAFGLPEDFLEWHPTCHHRADLAALWGSFQNTKDPRKLFYLWGHSYEFDRSDNWSLIERFGETVRAAREAGAVWCATNMEIFAYVTAWRRLWCSLDGRSFHNARGTALWMKAGGRLVRIGAGETLAF
jgi:hypothetical protein